MFLGYLPLNIHKVATLIASRTSGAYTVQDCVNIVGLYDTYARIGQINPMIALAQTLHHTNWLSSWWSQKPRCNPMDFGVTGKFQQADPQSRRWTYNEKTRTWWEGLSFEGSWSLAVQAHVGLVLVLCLPTGSGNEAQEALMGIALGVQPVPGHLWSRTRTLGEMYRVLGGVRQYDIHMPAGLDEGYYASSISNIAGAMV